MFYFSLYVTMSITEKMADDAWMEMAAHLRLKLLQCCSLLRLLECSETLGEWCIEDGLHCVH